MQYENKYVDAEMMYKNVLRYSITVNTNKFMFKNKLLYQKKIHTLYRVESPTPVNRSMQYGAIFNFFIGLKVVVVMQKQITIIIIIIIINSNKQ